MAVLSDTDRVDVNAKYQRDASAVRDAFANVVKADLQAAVNALDTFLSNNATAINNAIPLPARTALTTQQKAKLLMYVIEKRYLSGI